MSVNATGRAAVVLDTGAASRGSGNAGTNKEKTVRQWFVDHDLIESVLYLPEPSGANRVERDSLLKAARRAHAGACGKQTARQGSPKGERGSANQNLFYNTTAPGIVLFLNKAKPKEREGKVFMVNASQAFEKGDPKNFIPNEGIDRIVNALINWKEEEKFSHIIPVADAPAEALAKEGLKKNDYNISPSRYIHTSDAETYRPIPEIVAELKMLEKEAEATDKALRKILKQMGV